MISSDARLRRRDNFASRDYAARADDPIPPALREKGLLHVRAALAAQLSAPCRSSVSCKTAVVDGARRYTYRALEARVHRLANALRHMGVAQGDKVRCCLRTVIACWRRSLPCHNLAPCWYPSTSA
jgi:non-ribosomal peptide synthetase component E (peptide arylation enzyme)